MLNRRNFLQYASVSVAGSLTAPSIIAQNAPSAEGVLDTARLILGSPAGTILDVMCRRIADAIQPGYARNTLVDNRVGGSSQIATTHVKNAPADGTAVLVTPMPMMAMYTHTYKKLQYDPFADFAPVSLAATFDLALAVGPMVPAGVKNVDEFVAWCKANPSLANFGSPAAGSTPHFAGIILARSANIAFTHIPFLGTVPAITQMAGGQIASVIAPVGDFLPFVETGKCRMIGIIGSKTNRFAPAVPTFIEQGYKDVVTNDWFGVFVPARTPVQQIQRLGDALKMALAAPAVLRTLESKALVAQWSTSAELAARLKDDSLRWSGVVKSTGFSADS